MRKSLILGLLAAGTLSACGEKEVPVIVVPAPQDRAEFDGGGGGRSAFQASQAEVTAQIFGQNTAGGQVEPSGAVTVAPGAAAGPAAGPPGRAAQPAAAVGDPNRPQRKQGLWRLTTVSNGETTTSTLCVNPQSEAAYSAFDGAAGRGGGGRPGGGGAGRPGGGGGPPGGGTPGAAPGGPGGPGGGQGFGGPGGRQGGGGGRGANCPVRITKAGDGWRATANCTNTFGENTITIARTSTLSGDLQTRYTVTTRNSTRGGPQGEQTTNTTVTGQYQGACPAGARPGDLTTGGNTRNVLAGGGAQRGG